MTFSDVILHDVELMNVILQDTAGSERYNSMARVYYRNAKAAVVCYGKDTYLQETCHRRIEKIHRLVL